MSLINKAKSAGIWQAIEVFTQFILQFIYFAIMARLLLKEDYGLMAISNGIIGVGALFIQGGLGTALIQKKTINSNYINAALQTNLFIGTILFFLFFFLASPISSFYNDERLGNIIQVISFNFILLAISNITLSLLHKNYKFKNTSVVTVIALLCGYVIGLFMAYNNYGVWSLISATLTSSLIKTIGYLYFVPIKISYTIHFKEAKELFKFGSGMMLLAFSNYFSNKGLNLIFGKIFAPGVLGIYERASHLKTLPSQFLGNITDKVMFPIMSEIQDEDNRLINIFKFSMGLSNSLMIPTAIFLIFFTPEIVGILMGDKWLETILPLQIMFVVLPFSNAGRMADSIIRAKGLVYKNVTRKYIFTAIIIILSSTLGYFYGIVGASIGISISYIINYFMMIFLVRKVFHRSFNEIFYKPIRTGIKLGISLAFSTVIYKSIFNLWSTTNILYFIYFSIFLSVILFIVARFKPTVLGYYISTTLSIFLKK